ncbi:MAG: phosphatase PAP2 family protein [Chloroflexi bacterium]|nr:phosphatase PAP2 family protein [Chloroflexota bacterium]
MEIATKPTPLALSIYVSLIAVVASTAVAWRVDLFQWDVDITRWVQDFSTGPARFLRGWIFWMGIRGVAGALMVALFALLWLRRHRVEAIFLGLISIPDLFNLGLREIIGRSRPTGDLVNVLTGYGGVQGFSYPSGHSLHVLLFYGFLLYLATRFVANRLLVRTLWTGGVAYMLLSGLWLIYDGRHWFTDVMGGYIYGAFYLLVLIVAYRWANRWLEHNDVTKLAHLLPRFLRKPAEQLLRLIG